MTKKIFDLISPLILVSILFILSSADPGESNLKVTDSSHTPWWSRCYGGANLDKGFSVQQTNDGGFVVAGGTNSFGAGSDDVYLIKTDTLGSVLWTRTYGGNSYDYGRSVQQTEDGGYVIAGETNSFGSGSNDVFLIKTDASGNLQWTHTYGGSDWDYGYSVQKTADGGYVIAGATFSYGSGKNDFYLVKTDTQGNLQWSRAYGGAGDDYGYSVQQTTDGGYILIGVTNSFGAGSDDVYLLKTDSLGNLLWTRTYGGSSNDYGHSVQQTEDEGYIITGQTSSFGSVNRDLYLIKTDASGNVEWSKTYGGSGLDNGNSVQQTEEGGYIVAGATYSFGSGQADVFLIKTDTLGSVRWARAFGGRKWDYGYSVQEIQNGGYVVTGYGDSLITGAKNIVILTQLDSLGNTCFGEFVSSNENQVPTSVTDPTTQLTYPESLFTTPATTATLPSTNTTTICQELFPNYPPEFDLCPSSKTGLVGETLRFFISASDSNSADTLTLTRFPESFGTFPDSIQGIGVVQGEFVWVPDTADTQGTHWIFFYVSDQDEAADTCEVEIEVRINNPPVIHLNPVFSDTTIQEGETLSFSVYASDQDTTDTLTLIRYPTSFGTFPDSIQGMGEVTGEYIWTPGYGQVGEDSILFKVTDGIVADSVYVKITVENKVLMVISHHPQSDEEDVLIDDRILLTLSEPIKFETVNSSSFKVISRADSSLEGIISINYLTDWSTLTFRLPPGSMYSILDTITVTLTTDILDSADYGMAEDYFWEFYTGIGVYPGNTNNDLIVDERDILPLGFYWGKTGSSRGKGYQDISWSIKPAHRWNADSSWDPHSAVYADADGNGKVDEFDICGVANNWDSTISESLQKIKKSIDLSKEGYQEHIAIYEKIYKALLSCPESKGKKIIKEFLENILEKKSKPDEFEIFQNYPNPFNSMTVIKYSLPQDCQVEISLFNILGQKIKTLVDEYQTQGYKKIIWDGKNDKGDEVGSGIYFYRIKASSFSSTRKMLFVK